MFDKNIMKTVLKQVEKQQKNDSFIEMIDTCELLITMSLIQNIIGDKDLSEELNKAAKQATEYFSKNVLKAEHESTAALMEFAKSTTLTRINKFNELMRGENESR